MTPVISLTGYRRERAQPRPVIREGDRVRHTRDGWEGRVILTRDIAGTTWIHAVVDGAHFCAKASELRIVPETEDGA